MKRVVSGLMLTLLLISMSTLAFNVQSVSSSTANVLFFDDFNDGVTDGWIQHLGSWSVINQEYHVRVGIVENGISTVDGLNLTDCIIETKLRFGDAEAGFRAGIVFRYIDNEHYYALEVTNEYDGVELFKYTSEDPGYGYQLSYYRCPIDANMNYSLRIEVHGNLFTGYLDGQKVLNGSDGNYFAGNVGLRARRADVLFDDFAVYSANGLWWNNSWLYRRRIEITENSGYNLSDFPVEVTFEHNGNIQPNGADIRVADGLEIPSFVEECNNTHAKVVFEINLTALESKTIYIYYGNPSAPSPNYLSVPLTIWEGNTGHAIIDNRVYIGWNYTSWGWSNNVELWNDFRIDFNGNNDPADDNDLIRDYGSRQGGIGRHRADVQAIGLGDYLGYVQTPIYLDIKFADAKLRVYRNHNWVETRQADFLHMFSPTYDYGSCGTGTEQNLIDELNMTHPEWASTVVCNSEENPGWMAFRDSSSGDVFASTGFNIGSNYSYLQGGKEASDWDRCIDYSNRSRWDPVEPYDQPPNCRIYWYGDHSDNYTKIEELAAVLSNQPTVVVGSDTITVPDDLSTIQEAINHASEGDTVFVKSGTYCENVVVNKTLSLTGENNSNTIIDGGGIGDTVTITASGVYITNLTVRNGTCGINLQRSINNIIFGNVITNNSGSGIYLFALSSARISENEITDNNIGINLQGVWLPGSQANIFGNNIVSNNRGITVVNFCRANIFDNNITDNDRGPGIEIGAESAADIRNNTIIGNGEGILARHIVSIDCANNSITCNNGTGISVTYGKCVVSHNNITNNNGNGISISDPLSNSNLYENHIEANKGFGIHLYNTYYPDFGTISVTRNNIVANSAGGIHLQENSGHTIFNNTVFSNQVGVYLQSSHDNIISENDIINNSVGIEFDKSYNNSVFHNSCIDNTQQTNISTSDYNNFWDDGYPSGGNYWRDYNVIDLYRGVYQNETGSDGIWDTALIIDPSNRDNYPLTKPYAGLFDIGVTNITTSKSVIGYSYNLTVNIKVLNYGINTQTFNITFYANTTIICQTQITLTGRNSTTVTFAWKTTSVPYGNYTISAYATPVPNETDIVDNRLTDGWVIVARIGDLISEAHSGAPDGKVDENDLWYFCEAFIGYYKMHVKNPNCDFDEDCDIDEDDLWTMAEAFIDYWKQH